MEFFDGIFEKLDNLKMKNSGLTPLFSTVSADDRNRTCTPRGHKNL